MKKFSLLLSAALALSVLSACGNNDSAKKDADDKLEVYTTIFPLQDFTKKIGGEHVNVTSIYPAGADAHTYEPSQKQIVKLANSDLFVYNGVDLEPFVEDIEKSLEKEDVKMIDSSKDVALIKFADEHENQANHEGHDHEKEDAHKEDEHHHDYDPHIWLDPKNALKQAENIKNALVALQPNHKQDFEKNFNDLKTQLLDLEAQLKETINNAKTKEVLVSHAAYGYWEYNYGLKQIPIAGLSSSDEPSQKQLAAVAETAKEHNLSYILFETFATPKVAEVIQKETGAKILRLHHLSTISEEELKDKKDYVTLMKENIKVLDTAMN
ncbi:metal ABC transporter substrate-binding protein [Ectobacillus antri]|jgi:zinc transport system substrate-binding protein|uniref:metal ABC transporter substrate-binding protein n=1 Tax=Ectobacillus antri TaxID=2486280 RepID=UPI000F5967EF